jgi:flagellar hook protein FlgE
MIQGDGFFVVKSGGESLYTRAGSFTFDANGSLTTPSGQIVQGWMADDGVLNTAGAPTDIKLPIGISLAPTVTENITLTGNLSHAAPGGTIKEIPIKVYDADGAANVKIATFTKAADLPDTTWQMTFDGFSQDIVFPAGKPVDPNTMLEMDTVAVGPYTFDVHDLTFYDGNTEARVSNSDGSGAGVLSSYTVSNIGQIVGVFSNGLKQTLGQVALANFNNVNGLEKIGDSMFRSTVNSGLAQVGPAGTGGLGLITSGALEMSNVDLAQEFTNLVIAQRGFQANSRIITTSDEILQELVNLKR